MHEIKSSRPQIEQNTKYNVLLYEQYTIVRESLKKLLDSDGQIQVVDATDKLERIADLREKSQPHLTVISVTHTSRDDIEIILNLCKSPPPIKTVLLISEREVAIQQLAVRCGAAGVVYKEQNQETLLKAIKQVCNGEMWLNQKLMTKILNRDGSDHKIAKSVEEQKIALLSEREIEIARLVTKGLKNKAIAKTLIISEATVRHHLTSIFNKLEVKDRMNLLIFCYQYGLVKPENVKT